MPNKKVYFGTLDDMQWVPAPQANSTYNRVSWRASGTFLNGGGYQRQSGTSHKEMSLSWSVQQLEMIDKVLAQFNKGEMLYYIDPIAAKYNVLPPHVAQYQPDNPQGVDFVDTGSAGALGYPRKAAVYSGANTLATVPVPAGQNLWVGAHGNATGGSGVAVAGDGSGTPEVLSTRTNLVQNGRAKYTSGTVEVRRNRAIYPRASNGSWYTVYPAGDGVATAFGTTDAGRPYIAATWSTVSVGGIIRLITYPASSATHIAVTPGETIPISVVAALSNPAINQNVRIVIDWYNGSTWISSSMSPWTPVTDNINSDMNRVSLTTPAAPSGASVLRIYVQIDSANIKAGTVFRARDLLVGDTSPYFDGSYSPDPDLTPSWTGPANASASILSGKNVIGVAKDTSRLTVQATMPDGAPALWAPVRPGGAANSGLWWQIPAQPQGRAVAVSMEVWAPDGVIINHLARLQLRGAPGTVFGTVIEKPSVIPTDGFQRYTGVSTISVDYPTTQLGVTLSSSANQERLYFRNMIVAVADTEAEALAAVQTYFDGDTANKQDGLVTTTYTWNGTAGQTSSTETVTYNPNATVSVPMLSTSDVQRVNTKVQGGQNLTISTTGTGAVQLNGLIAQILPEGETPEPGGFISGQGHSGLRLNGDPMVTQYSVSIPNAQIGVSAEFIETGAWE